MVSQEQEIRDIISERIHYLKDLMPRLKFNISISKTRIRVELINQFSLTESEIIQVNQYQPYRHITINQMIKFDDRSTYNDEFKFEFNYMMKLLSDYFNTSSRVTKIDFREKLYCYSNYNIYFPEYYSSFVIRNNGFYSLPYDK